MPPQRRLGRGPQAGDAAGPRQRGSLVPLPARPPPPHTDDHRPVPRTGEAPAEGGAASVSAAPRSALLCSPF